MQGICGLAAKLLSLSRPELAEQWFHWQMQVLTVLHWHLAGHSTYHAIAMFNSTVPLSSVCGEIHI